jgi:hypothetical protein
MSFLRRNKNATGDKDHTSPTPTQPTPAPAAQPSAQGDGDKKQEKSSGGGIRQWLIDSYNGLYKIVLEPSMPTRATVLLVIVGLVIGLLWAYAIQPTVFTGANPNRLNQAAQDQWIKMVAANYDRGFYADEQATNLLSRVDSPGVAIERMLSDSSLSAPDREALQSISTIAESIGGTATPQSGGFISELLGGWLVPIVLLVILIPILTLLWRLLIYPNIAAPIVQQIRMSLNKEYRDEIQKQRDEIRIQQQQRRLAEEMAKETTVDETLGTPIMKRASIYQEGRSYDDSFEIELPLDQGGDFLGQCGAVIAEAVDPDNVAIEVWLFDMLSQQNLKRIFVTPQGNSDPSVRSKLEGDVDNPATDIIVAQPGVVATINSDKLQLQAKMMAVESNDAGRFKSFQMQIQAWQKDGSSAGASAGMGNAGVMPPPIPPAQPPKDYSDITFDPPPAPPASQPPLAPPPQQPPMNQPPANQPPGYGGIQPLSPPPMTGGGMPSNPPQPPQQPPPMQPDDDDPFGGTGDFTPLGS